MKTLPRYYAIKKKKNNKSLEEHFYWPRIVYTVVANTLRTINLSSLPSIEHKVTQKNEQKLKQKTSFSTRQ